MTIKSVLRVFAFLICAFVSLPALSECKPGKFPVTLQTPSGKVKTLCVSDNAVEGIENASEHSSGTILPATCPDACWTAEELSVLDNKYPGGLGCKLDPNGSVCYGSDGAGNSEEVLSWTYVNYADAFICYSSIGIKSEITREEAVTCDALLKPYAQ